MNRGAFGDQMANLTHVGGEQRRERQFAVIRLQLVSERRIVFERDMLGLWLQKEVEWIIHRHLSDEIDFDNEFSCLFWEDEPRKVVRLRVLLPVDEVFVWCDLEGVTQNLRAAMWCRPQTYDVWRQCNGAVKLVLRDVTKSDVDGHAGEVGLYLQSKARASADADEVGWWFYEAEQACFTCLQALLFGFPSAPQHHSRSEMRLECAGP
jgi:hypothetical protein